MILWRNKKKNTLIPVVSGAMHDWQFVVLLLGNASTDYGVVVSCDHKERTCMVKWMKPYFPGKSQR